MKNNVSQVIAENKGLVYWQLHKFGLSYDQDAESIGYEALWNAVETFDETKGYKLSTYAKVCIYNALGSYVRTLKRQRQLTLVSYNSSVDIDGEDKEMLNVLPSTVICAESEVLKEELNSVATGAFIAEYEKLTNPRHLAIVSMWQEADYDISTTDIAKAVGVSQSYVSQILNNFKFRLRKRIGAYLD